MLRGQLIRQIGRYAGGEIDINELLTAVEAYSSASNDGKPLVSGSLPVEDIKKAIFQFKKECLPDAESPFHYEAEIWSGMQSFIRWLESKGNDR